MNWLMAIIFIETSICLCFVWVWASQRRARDAEAECRWRCLLTSIRYLEEMDPKIRLIGEILGLSDDPDVESVNVFGVLRQRIEVGNEDARTSARYCEGAIFQILNELKRELHVVKEAVVLPSPSDAITYPAEQLARMLLTASAKGREMGVVISGIHDMRPNAEIAAEASRISREVSGFQKDKEVAS